MRPTRPILKYSTQQAYDDDLKILKKTVGARRLDKLTGEDFLRWYRKYKEPRAKGGPNGSDGRTAL